jgi:TetR/AcrR family transcriptional repressor of bet genes
VCNKKESESIEMPKVGMQPVRLRQIIDAAIETIYIDGVEASSIRQIGMRAGVSPSLITHYFGSRDQLHTEILRHLNREISRTIAEKLRHSQSPLKRLYAIGEAQFAPTHFEPATAATWLALWAAIPHNEEMRRFQHIYERRLRSNLIFAFRPLVSHGDLDLAVNCTTALIDGLWIKAVQPTSPITTANAFEIFCRFIDVLVVRSTR